MRSTTAVGVLLAAVAVGALLATVEVSAEEVQQFTSRDAEVELLGDGKEKEKEPAEDSGAPSGGHSLQKMATSAGAKADLALDKIKTAKELRAKAREALKKKGKPIPEILKQGALDDVHQRVMDAKEKLASKFGSSRNAELEAKAEAKRENPDEAAKLAVDNGEADEAKVKAAANGNKATMYKAEEKGTKSEMKAAVAAEKTREEAMAAKNKAEKKALKAAANTKVGELEVKMKEKAKEKMQAGAVESDADFNHRQIAQEAYNKQVMGYVLAWEKTHGSPQVFDKNAAAIKDTLSAFVDSYEQQHAKITADISVSDTP